MLLWKRDSLGSKEIVGCLEKVSEEVRDNLEG